MSQPTVQLSCNPYDGLSPRLQLECNAYGTETYVINWFRQLNSEKNDGVQLQNTKPELLSDRTSRVNVWTRQKDDYFTRVRLSISALQAQDVGKYWCHIGIKVNNTTIEYLQPSQQINILPKELYDGFPPCSTLVYLDEPVSQCATEPLHSPPSQTTSSDCSTSCDDEEMHTLTKASSTTEGEDGLTFSQWSCVLIVIGAIVVIALLLTVQLLMALGVYRRTRRGTDIIIIILVLHMPP